MHKIPYNEEAELAVLGSILLEPEIIDKISERLQPEDFYRKAHQILFQTLIDLKEDQKPIDLVTITELLHERGKLEEVGGVPYLNEVTTAVPTTAHVDHYVKIVEEKAIRRYLMQESQKIARQAYQTENIEAVLADAEERLRNVSERNSKSTKDRNVGMQESLMASFEHLEAMAMGKIKPGLKTGFYDIDHLLGGLHPSELMILAARPSMGKTALALNFCLNIALGKEPKSVLIFSLEMKRETLVNRMISAYGNVDGQVFRTGNVKDEDWEKITKTMAALEKTQIQINEEALTLSEIRADARKAKREKGIDVIIIDYLQLIEADGNFSSPNERVSHVSRSLKLMAKELDIPVIALSQLSRAPEMRNDKRPILADLRDSGAIEQDADIVAFLYRDDYYDQDSELKNIAELIVAKNRNGQTGKVELGFLKNFNKFLSLDMKVQG
jgi:replicative DNA helicase